MADEGEITMVNDQAGAGAFAPGGTVVRRDVYGGRVFSALPCRVLDDDGSVLEVAYWPGIRCLTPDSRTRSVRTGDREERARGLEEAAASGSWRLDLWTWQDTAVRARFEAGESYSVHRFQGGGSGEPLYFYVNFELPITRTPTGIDTCDLLIDLVVRPDLSSWEWKDADEYAQARRLGLITDARHQLIEQARERAVGQVQERTGPFAEGWTRWAPDPAWPLPELPDGAVE
jgi:hypothetical protein